MSVRVTSPRKKHQCRVGDRIKGITGIAEIGATEIADSPMGLEGEKWVIPKDPEEGDEFWVEEFETLSSNFISI